MLEQFNYTNSFNETLEFGKDFLFVNENDLRDFAWSVTSKNDKISSFKKGIVSKTIPVILKCNSETEGVQLRNRIFEVFEKDVLTRNHGKIQIGDYYLRCFITGSKKTEYLNHKNHMKISLTVQTDQPEWIKESTTIYGISSGSATILLSEGDVSTYDYPHDFPYDFMNEVAKYRIENTGLISSNFIIQIFGQVENPKLYIEGHEYSVDVLLEEGDYLTIDSVNKTIVLTKNNGEKVNCFNNRNKDSYIFEKIPSGIHEVTTTNQEINFNITLLEERSEPKWT